MLSITKAKKLLNANRIETEKLTDKQVRQVLDLLEQFAKMSVDSFIRNEV